MSSNPTAPGPADGERRAALVTACAVGGVGAAAIAVPFVSSLAPSERAKAAGAPVQVDMSGIAPGEKKTVEWRGKPVWILHRTAEMIESVKMAEGAVADPKSQRTAFPTPEYARNQLRSIKPQYFIAVGICTHLGCSPVGPLAPGSNNVLGADPGFLCPCHGSSFDLAGRVYKAKPAPDNLEVPPHMYVSDTTVVIGEDKA
jgi:ubiquinol-cytochrome c reductase iron-sulfur subunit